MRATTALAAMSVTLALAGCGGNTTGQVRAKVKQFARAVESRDYATICNDVLARSLLADFARAGITCEQAMGVALGQVKSPRLTVGRVSVNGDNASVVTVSQASGQNSVLSALHLVHTPEGWRIVSLGAPIRTQ